MLNVITCLRFSRKLVNVRLLHQAQTAEKTFQEIKIPVPWGHIAGKWWGRTDVKPLLGLHGWQDNAGTWDTLAPLLPEDISLLAIDSPGHGLSSHYPPGLPYYYTDQLFSLRLIVQHFGWDKISLLAHSLGAVQSYLYSSVYPEQVEHFIAIDAFKPLSIKFDEEVKKLGTTIDKFLETDSMDQSKNPTYTYDEMVEKLYEGMIGKSLTRDSCKILLKRGIVEAGDGKYHFSRDARLKAGRLSGWPHHFILHMATQITCNVLIIKALPGIAFESPEITNEVMDTIKKTAKVFRYETVEGLHHVHLNNPEKVCPIIVNFLNSTKEQTSDTATSSS